MEGLAFDKDVLKAPVFIISLVVAADRFLVNPLFCFLLYNIPSLYSEGFVSSGQDFHGKIISLIGKVRFHSV